MGVYNYVNFEMDCPRCGSREREFQTKDGDPFFNLVEIEFVTTFYAICRACGHWIELTRDAPTVAPRKGRATLADALALGFRVVPGKFPDREAFRMGLNVVPDVDCKHSEPQPSKNDNEIDRLWRGVERILYSIDTEMLDDDLARDIDREIWGLIGTAAFKK